MKILSLFDGMSCGMIALKTAGVTVDRYVAYEIDKYAVKTSKHNFPEIEHMGDVFTADFTQYRGKVNGLIGGSPCTFWSIAQTNNRETTASGFGWELFSQYVRALNEVQPDWFIYENNKSMSKAIRDSIRETFGFEEICINSALVSAQNRQRYYWVGKRNEDGTYSKVPVEQPEDRGILLKDVLDVVGNNIKVAPYSIMDGHELKFHDHKVRQGDKSGSRQGTYIYVDGDGKSNSVIAGHAGDEKVLFRISEENAHLAYQTFEVRNGFVNILGLSAPTSFTDGLYGIRYLSILEIQRLQTVPEWYDFSCVSATQAFKMLGNGWTCEVIAHLIKACLEVK